MLTRNDIQILKEIFVTKEEFNEKLTSGLNSLERRLENKIDSLISEVRTVINTMADPELVNDHEIRIQKLEQQTN